MVTEITLVIPRHSTSDGNYSSWQNLSTQTMRACHRSITQRFRSRIHAYKSNQLHRHIPAHLVTKFLISQIKALSRDFETFCHVVSIRSCQGKIIAKSFPHLFRKPPGWRQFVTRPAPSQKTPSDSQTMGISLYRPAINHHCHFYLRRCIIGLRSAINNMGSYLIH